KGKLRTAAFGRRARTPRRVLLFEMAGVGVAVARREEFAPLRRIEVTRVAEAPQIFVVVKRVVAGDRDAVGDERPVNRSTGAAALGAEAGIGRVAGAGEAAVAGDRDALRDGAAVRCRIVRVGAPNLQRVGGARAVVVG